MVKYRKIEECNLEDFNNVVIYGAGPAGRVNAWVVKTELKRDDYLFCDRDEKKHNADLEHPIISVSDAAKKHNACFIVGFYNNNKEKIESSITLLHANNVGDDCIFVIDMEDEYYNEIYSRYLKNYIDDSVNNKREKESLRKVEKICFLSGGFNAEKELIGGGGPIGVICMQKKILGNSFSGIEIIYPYYETNEEYENPINRFSYMTGASQAAYEMSLKMNNTIYIANDVFSAFGLYRAGKNYRIIFHAQGDNVNEMRLWGEELTETEENLIKTIEKIAFENAQMVSFPSNGAKVYFDNCFEGKLSYNSGRAMFNTVIDMPEIKSIEGISKRTDCVTFLSIGQMTRLKGVDLVPYFLQKYYRQTNKKIRWIVVAGGITTLEEEIQKTVDNMCMQGVDLEYVAISERITHSQIFYLFNISDVYIMLHRLSIFDFSTLEAMINEMPIILSDIPGNQEFNLDDNIYLYNDNSCMEDIDIYIEKRNEIGKRNKNVYDKHFSVSEFKKLYSKYINEFICSVVEEHL